MSILEEMQPLFRHVPPVRPRFTKATCSAPFHSLRGHMDSCTKADYDEVESIHNRAELLKALKEPIIGKRQISRKK